MSVVHLQNISWDKNEWEVAQVHNTVHRQGPIVHKQDVSAAQSSPASNGGDSKWRQKVAEGRTSDIFYATVIASSRRKSQYHI